MEAAYKTETLRKKIPTLELSGETQLPESTNCMACSEDGRYLSLGHSQGLSVWCASSLICIAEWLQDRLEVTSIQITSMAEKVYLLGTVDDMGVARVFAYHCERIHLLSVINIMENINTRIICLTFELSEGGGYGAASFSCNGSVWLEVCHFPSEAWLKELEIAESKKQEPNSSEDVDVNWSPVAVVIKIKPPRIPGTTLDDPLEVLQMPAFFTNCLALDVITSSSHQWDEQSSDTDVGKTNESPRRCTQHFLLPCGFIKPNSQPGFPIAVGVWWSGSHNLFQYLLQKNPKNKADVEPVPDVLWPNAKEILCSAVSRCTRYVALGLEDGLVCVWDRQSASPLPVVSVSAADSAFCRMQIVDYCPKSADDSQTFTAAKVSLLVLCKSGVIHTVTTGRGGQPCTAQLNERPNDSGELQTVTASVRFLQSLLLVVQRNGKIFLQDVIKKTIVCFLILPATHLIASPCTPVYVLDTKQQTLFIKGDPELSCNASSKGGSQSQLFIFHFGEPDIFKKNIVSLPDSPGQQNTPSCATLEESCSLYLQQRALSVDERHKAITQTWKQLQETAVAVEQRHSRAAAS
ncbi:WD repeat-containing protein 93 isoform X2 [Centropristis striata]|uniref:WD repeat-containing protein 93 isoform X2 n=1 Tax=Centropristis striata TaxID=184440 RepID=UPI0027E00CB7|nr:WD repeat-containing protein 93 isoform X2 [Centropristis striata]